MSASRLAKAQLSGYQTRAARQPPAPRRRADGTSSACPELHSAAARTTWDFTTCRAEANRDARSTARSAWPTDAAPSPMNIASSARTHASRTGSRPAASVADEVTGSPQQPRRTAANRPTPRASAANPIRASACASTSGPATAQARPSHARAARCPPSCRRNDARVLRASDVSGSSGVERGERLEVGDGTGVAALTARRDGPQPHAVAGCAPRAAASDRGRPRRPCRRMRPSAATLSTGRLGRTAGT